MMVIIAIVVAAPGNEVLPERYLKPRDFNHHPYTDVGIPASLKRQTTISSPFAVLAKLRPREAPEYSERNLVYYPVPHNSVLQKKIESNEIPKNYAFTYTVKDHLSGDDFSHSQAHNGKATKGQYRVKLPDGRTQIVSYTADHKGYRADVQYEDKVPEKPYSDVIFKPTQALEEVAVNLSENIHQAYPTYQEEYLNKYQYVPVQSATVETPTISEKSEVINYVTVSPVQLDTENNGLKILLNHNGKTAIVPEYQGKTAYLTKYVVPQYQHQYVAYKPSQHQQQYVKPTASPQFVSTTSTPQYIAHVSSTPLYPVEEDSTANPKNTYHFYTSSSTTASSNEEGTVLVTPRPVHEPDADAKLESSLVYRLLK
ncbi:hypothetical protein RUM44_007424 [Polyplax serrata]|uniref:Uncharacterized protein n=1 Tax=Polyplax serrata TaxID=468196 RepID=A0ABR1B0M7_POLSC